MKKFFLFLLILGLTFSLCSCDLFCGCGENIDFPEESFGAPDYNSLITYELSNGDTLILLYRDSKGEPRAAYFYGEWKHGDEIKRIRVGEEPLIDTCLIHGINYYGFTLCIDEIVGLSVEEIYSEHVVIGYQFPDGQAIHATFNAGILNSQKLTVDSSGEELSIVAVKVEDAPFSYWDWNDPTWADFDGCGEDTHFVASDIGLSYHPWRNMGELKIDDTTLPIKLVFFEEVMAVSVYDLSNNGSTVVMYLTGHMDAENADVFVIDKINCTREFAFADRFANVTNTRLIKTEVIDH